MQFYKTVLLMSFFLFSSISFAGPNYIGGKITSLNASATEPAIRLSGNVSPENCDGGTYGWLYFKGTPEERNRVYATALALSLTGHVVTIYANDDGEQCRIHSIQALSGLGG